MPIPLQMRSGRTAPASGQKNPERPNHRSSARLKTGCSNGTTACASTMGGRASRYAGAVLADWID
jgi:hypothetical protein